ncbi:hypothetical protein ACFWGD_03655 [Corynebacterium sp. NPDC060344]|uniref:hypothetical protein n=1 Tax=Corynebacterium sp. NPDC060344 TaxID=3347101 RepID=UPI00365B5D70
MTPDAAPPTPRHPVYLVPGHPGDRAAEAFLPAGLQWAEAGPDPVADAVGLLRGMDADASALDALTGFAGLERLLVWAKAQTMAGVGPVGVRFGPTPDRQLSWLRRVQGPAELSDMLDLINPRVDRHRSMPDVFGDRARRARLLESLWSWGHSWQRFVDSGGVHLRADGPVDPRVSSVARWIGVGIEEGAEGGVEVAAGEPTDVATPAPLPRLTLADLGAGGDGAPRYRMRVHAPLHLAFPDFGDSGEVAETDVGAAAGATGVRRQAFVLDDGADPGDFPESTVRVDASPRGVVVQVAGFAKRFGAPSIFGVCAMEKVRVAAPDTWAGGWGDILVWFRADPARLP